MIEQRIQLAEAMGWERWVTGVNATWRNPSDKGDHRFAEGLPDPFTDANDDYAVLEWSRLNLGVAEQVQMHSKLGHSADYQIGDYARAAISVLTQQGRPDV